MKRNKWTARLASLALVLVTVIVAALAAGTQGTQTDPLVTLSYLNEKALPELLTQVDKKVEEGTRELREKLEDKGQAVFQTAEISEGKTMVLTGGSQLLLRSGTASCNDGLVDLTTGETVWGELAVNHLYIASGDGQKVTAAAKSTFMILGSYTVQ